MSVIFALTFNTQRKEEVDEIQGEIWKEIKTVYSSPYMAENVMKPGVMFG